MPTGATYALRPCKRCPILCFVVLWNTKHGQFQNFWMYQKYRVKIVSKISQNTSFDSNFNLIYNYDYGMQGPLLSTEVVGEIDV
jgi:hypothetical protein